MLNFDHVELIDKDEHIEQASRAMKAMSYPFRLKILCVLGDREISVQDIVESAGTSQSNISQHLAILRDKGVPNLPWHTPCRCTFKSRRDLSGRSNWVSWRRETGCRRNASLASAWESTE